jgi:hypothetical protein
MGFWDEIDSLLRLFLIVACDEDPHILERVWNLAEQSVDRLLLCSPECAVRILPISSGGGARRSNQKRSDRLYGSGRPMASIGSQPLSCCPMS